MIAILRSLRRSKAFAAAVILMLALGIALSAAMFSVLHGIAVKPLPYPDSGRLYVLGSRHPERGESATLSGVEIQEGGALVPDAQAWAGYYWSGRTYTGGERPRALSSLMVSADFFRVLGVAPLYGRWLDAGDAGQPRIVLGERTWRELTGADPAIVGRSLRFGDYLLEVVGVMPQALAYPARDMAFYEAIDPAAQRGDPASYEQARFHQAVLRLHGDADERRLRSQLEQASARLAERYPASHGERSLSATPMLESVIGDVKPVVYALWLLACLVLLLAIAHVASLVVTRGLDRAGDLAVHRALGADAARVRALLAGEVVVLAGVATLVAIPLAQAALALYVRLADSGLPRTDEVALDGTAMAFAALVSLLAMLLAGALPAHALARSSIGQGLRAHGSRGDRGGAFQRWLSWVPALGIALSTVALATALLLAWSLHQLRKEPLGFEPASVAVAHTFAPVDMSRDDVLPALAEHARRILEESARAGATRAAIVSGPPLSPVGRLSMAIRVPGREPPAGPDPFVRTVMGDWLGTLGMRLHAGRDFEAADGPTATRVAIVNQRFVERFLGPGAEAIDATVLMPEPGREAIALRIVGVVEDARLDGPRAEPVPEVWLPLAQYPVPSQALLVRADGDPRAWLEPMHKALFRVTPDQAVWSAYTLADELDRQYAAPRFFARNAGVFAAIALVLAMLGVYGIVADDLVRRRRDLAVRAALGAAPRALAGHLLLRAIPRMAAGLGLGALVAMAALELVRGVIHGLDGQQGWSVLAACLAVTVCALAACLHLARVASRTSPALALRES